MSFKPQKHVLASKIETTYATDSVPTGAANAVLISNPKLVPLQQDALARTGLKPYLGNRGKVIAGKHVGFDYDIEIAGSGAAGTAPGYGVCLKSCAMAELINPTAVTGTAQAGAASAITLAVGASAVDNAYKYMTIQITGGTGAGQFGTIRSYVGSTKVATMYEAWAIAPDATSAYSILAQTVYTPVSSGESSRSSYFNIDGILHKMLGVRSELSLKFAKGAIPMFTLKDIGLYALPTDTALPATTFSGISKSVGCNQANTVGTIHGYAAVFSDISLALGNVNAYRNLIGSESIQFTDRQPSGSVTFEHPTLAAKDFYSITQAETLGSLNVTHGTAAGNKVKVYCPSVQLTNPTDSTDAVRMMGLTLDVQPVDGDDEIILTIF